MSLTHITRGPPGVMSCASVMLAASAVGGDRTRLLLPDGVPGSLVVVPVRKKFRQSKPEVSTRVIVGVFISTNRTFKPAAAADSSMLLRPRQSNPYCHIRPASKIMRSATWELMSMTSGNACLLPKLHASCVTTISGSATARRKDAMSTSSEYQRSCLCKNGLRIKYVVVDVNETWRQ